MYQEAKRMLKLAEIAAVLGCSVQAASFLRRGVYERVAKESDLPARYAMLMRLIEEARAQVSLERICMDCPREDCTGCRVAEITD
jgi:hypothetical protein